jgi:hypothetical protein
MEPLLVYPDPAPPVLAQATSAVVAVNSPQHRKRPS